MTSNESASEVTSEKAELQVEKEELLLKVDTLTGIAVAASDPGGVQLWEDGPYWAGWNVGATKPEEYGYYFWWGDMVGYERNASNDSWVSVKNGSSFTFTESNCPTYGMDDSELLAAGYTVSEPLDGLLITR